MKEEKFKIVLDDDEKVLWCDGVNKSAFVKKCFTKLFLFGLFPPFAVLLLGIPYTLAFLVLSLLNVIPMLVGVIHFIFSVCAVWFYIKCLNMEADNTFLCITDKRVIKRAGVFNNKFIHYSLKNIGTIEVSGGLFDSKDENPSADLNISVKDFHMNADGEDHNTKSFITSLNNAYDCYKKLSELTEGNNESIRIKHEK